MGIYAVGIPIYINILTLKICYYCGKCSYDCSVLFIGSCSFYVVSDLNNVYYLTRPLVYTLIYTYMLPILNLFIIQFFFKFYNTYFTITIFIIILLLTHIFYKEYHKIFFNIYPGSYTNF